MAQMQGRKRRVIPRPPIPDPLKQNIDGLLRDIMFGDHGRAIRASYEAELRERRRHKAATKRRKALAGIIEISQADPDSDNDSIGEYYQFVYECEGLGDTEKSDLIPARAWEIVVGRSSANGNVTNSDSSGK